MLFVIKILFIYNFSPQNDEYVVYNVNQQRLRYLVEFTVDEEQPGARLDIEDSDVLMDTYLSSQLADIGQFLPCQLMGAKVVG